VPLGTQNTCWRYWGRCDVNLDSLPWVFSGPLAIYLFARSVMLLGASRAALFAALVPAATLIVGFLTLGEAPSTAQVVGLVIVLVGFRLTQKA
jgi:drug/metabolite transporter (DMT)-like permease